MKINEPAEAAEIKNISDTTEGYKRGENRWREMVPTGVQQRARSPDLPVNRSLETRGFRGVAVELERLAGAADCGLGAFGLGEEYAGASTVGTRRAKGPAFCFGDDPARPAERMRRARLLLHGPRGVRDSPEAGGIPGVGRGLWQPVWHPHLAGAAGAGRGLVRNSGDRRSGGPACTPAGSRRLADLHRRAQSRGPGG